MSNFIVSNDFWLWQGGGALAKGRGAKRNESNPREINRKQTFLQLFQRFWLPTYHQNLYFYSCLDAPDCLHIIWLPISIDVWAILIAHVSPKYVFLQLFGRFRFHLFCFTRFFPCEKRHGKKFETFAVLLSLLTMPISFLRLAGVASSLAGRPPLLGSHRGRWS